MGPHKYFVGQTVLVAYGKYPDIQKGERFRVARLLPLRDLRPSTESKANLMVTNGSSERASSHLWRGFEHRTA